MILALPRPDISLDAGFVSSPEKFPFLVRTPIHLESGLSAHNYLLDYGPLRADMRSLFLRHSVANTVPKMPSFAEFLAVALFALEALYPSAFHREKAGASDGIRTHDLLFTKQLLYP